MGLQMADSRAVHLAGCSDSARAAKMGCSLAGWMEDCLVGLKAQSSVASWAGHSVLHLVAGWGQRLVALYVTEMGCHP